MKKIKMLLISLLLTAMISGAVSPTYVYADIPNAKDLELDLTGLSEEDDQPDDEEFEELESYDAEADDEEADGIEADEEETDAGKTDEAEGEDGGENDGSIRKPAITFTKEITSIDVPEKTEYSFEYKTSLVSLLEELPRTLKVWHEDESAVIDVIWKSKEDYDDNLYKYTFIPDLEGYTLAKELELPELIVTFEGDRPELAAGLEKDELTDKSPYVDDDMVFTGSIPATYNSKEKGKLPPVRDQGEFGTCWSFSTVGGIEADLIHDGKASKNSINLSELQIAYFGSNPYTDPKKCRKDSASGGNIYTALNMGGTLKEGGRLLSNHVGAVNESVVPYSKATTFSGGTKYVTSKDTVHLKNAYYINYSDRNSVKKAIMDHGAVTAGFGYSNSYYKPTTNSFYNPYGYYSGSGHAIDLVGWSDSFSRYNFLYTPSGDGAWLVRNSWGSQNYDLSGYFWMSYYDGGLGSSYGNGYVVAYDAVKEKADNCYSYSGQNKRDRIFYGGSNCTQKVSFKVSGGESVKSVGVEVGSPNVNISVTVKNKSTGKTAKGSVKGTYAGIYTVNLKNQLKVPRNTTVEVTVNYRSRTGQTVEVTCEETGSWNVNGVYIKGVCDKGFTLNGRKYSYDSRVKVYTVKGGGSSKVKVKKVSLNKSKITIKTGKTYKLKAKIKPSNATNKKVTWSTSNKKVATVSKSGVVKGKKAGKATITVTTKDGKKKARCKVTVKKAKVKVKSVSLNIKKKTLKRGKTLKLKAKIKPSNATNKKVTWKSSKKKVATVSSKGVVKAKSPGKTKITVTTKDGKKKASCTITVKKK